jgi:predicted Zn-dependent protease
LTSCGPTRLLALLALGCAHAPAQPSREPWTPTRHDYAVFRDTHPELLDPNYLPFMAHRFAFAEETEDRLLLCRWPEERFPLAVHVAAPVIPEEIQNEFRPVAPEVFVAAVERALRNWQETLEGVVSFELVSEPDEAELRIRLLATIGPAPDPDVQVLGITPVARACRVRGGESATGRFDVDFEVEEVAIYIADRFGLLTETQVERITLHELGHALGMRGHSPIPADVMYEVARDRTVDRLSPEDINSFRMLYALPNGTLYGRLPHGVALERPLPRAPAGPPRLAEHAHRDERLGFAVRLARGWLRIPTPYGVVGVDGLAWDYEASFQLIVRTFPSIEAYLALHGAAHVGSGQVSQHDETRIAGLAAHRMRVEQAGGELLEQHVFMETGDGRLVVAIADASDELYEVFLPWFDAMLDSLEVFPARGPR